MRRRNGYLFLKGIVFMQLFLLTVILGLTVDLNGGFLNSWSKARPLNLLQPLGIININEDQAEQLLQENSLLLTGSAGLIKQLGWVDLSSDNMAQNMIGSQIQVLAYTGLQEKNQEYGNEDPSKTEANNPVSKEFGRDGIETAEPVDTTIFNGKTICLYCTHSAETYIPDSGQARVDGKRGLINSVAQKIEQELKSKGINAQYINTIHDFPDYNSSYTNSRATVKKLLQDNNNIMALLDIHRDSIPGASTAPTIEIKGKKSARILIVVGTDERKPHPDWKKNFRFAQNLYVQGEKMYPGLIKGITTKAGTYNQEFHSSALLLEFGSDYNTLEEANYAARLFTEVLIQVLKEDF